MKKYFIIVLLCIAHFVSAQKPCDFGTDVKDSLGTYKATKEYLMYESNFGSKKDYIYFSLVNTDGMPALKVQLINKNNGFVKAKCFNNKSKMYIQLNNGKIITLLYQDIDNCGTMLTDENKNNVRVLSGAFLFLKGSMEMLKSVPISFIRFKFSIENQDYIISKKLHSELDKLDYSPENYFINYLHCVDGK